MAMQMMMHDDGPDELTSPDANTTKDRQSSIAQKKVYGSTTPLARLSSMMDWIGLDWI